MAFISLSEGIGLLLLVPLLRLVGLDIQGGSLSQIEALITSLFNFLGLEVNLASILIFYIIIISANAYLLRYQTRESYKLQYEFAAYLRKKLFQAITYSQWLFFIKKQSADFAHALTYEIERISLGVNQFLAMLATSLVLLVYIIFALEISGLITALIFLVGLILLLLLKRRTQSPSMSGLKLSESSRDMYSALVKQLDGMKTVKSFQMEEFNISLFSTIVDRVKDKYLEAIKSYSEVKFLFDVGSVVILSTVVYILVIYIQIPTAELLILLFLFVRMIPLFSQIQRNYQYFINMVPAFSNVSLLEDKCISATESLPKGDLKDFKDTIKLKNLDFSYPGKEKSTLKDLNLTIKAEAITALLGHSGAGKSTVADLIMGLLTPHKGHILIDEEDLSQNIISWRDKIGYVSQDTYLFNDTIQNNLLFASPQSSTEDLEEALKLASAYDFVLNLPQGKDTVVGDRGVSLSGGERQRLALARALLRKPRLLILDEATSNLDSENEEIILNSLEKLKKSMAILIITHRLSTIKGADYIYIINEGRLVEEGSWKELIEKKGKFKYLYQNQA